MTEPATGPLRDVPIDWEALEDAFENNAPEVHSYLHVTSGEVLRVVDGVADPQMHIRIASDAQYLRIDPVSSREQYRWMERFIPIAEDDELRPRLAHAIDGKGAFRRFKDVLMTYVTERERWFVFRSERLRTFMEAWLAAHAIRATARPQWADAAVADPAAAPSSVAIPDAVAPPVEVAEPPKSQGRKPRTAETARQQLREVCEALGARELDTLVSFAEYLKARRAARGFAHHFEQQRDPHHRGPRQEERSDPSAPGRVGGAVDGVAGEGPSSVRLPDPRPAATSFGVVSDAEPASQGGLARSRRTPLGPPLGPGGVAVVPIVEDEGPRTLEPSAPRVPAAAGQDAGVRGGGAR